jgi:hypothetical protein
MQATRSLTKYLALTQILVDVWIGANNLAARAAFTSPVQCDDNKLVGRGRRKGTPIFWLPIHWWGAPRPKPNMPLVTH